MFKKMTIGKQIAFGFGVILVLLVVINVTSYTGVSRIVKNAVSMITGDRIKAVMSQNEINHLNWVGAVTEYMNDPNVKVLTVETDPKKFAFGKWLNGEGRKNAEAAVPALVPLFKSIEKPNELLHHSAIDIARKMNKLDCAKNLTEFYSTELGLRKWRDTLIEEILSMKRRVSVGLDSKKCSLGRWLYDGQADTLEKEFPVFAPLIEKIKKPHRLIYEGGKHVNACLASGDYDGAMAVVEKEVEPNLEIVLSILSKARDLTRDLEKDQQEAARIFMTVTRKNMEEVQNLMHRASETVDQNMVTQDVLLGDADRLKTIITIVGAIALILGIFLAFLIVRGLVRSLSKIADSMNDGADQVAAASGQVSSASHSLAEGSAEQAASIEETSSSLEEMSSMTQQNADNAGQADSLMKEASQVIGQAGNSMSELTTQMGEISRASEATQKIIKTIDEVAFQTNLLALNAAVEAARAGEAGAGFAVVADEVRNLAMRSAEAAKSTAVLIEGTVKKVGDGSDLADRTNEVFARVVENVNKVGELIGEISAASTEQSQGIGQINTAVSEMDKVVQQNAAGAEESASASEEMNAQAEQIKSMVGELAALVGGSARGTAQGSKVVTPSVNTVAGSTKSGTGGATRHALPAPIGKAKGAGVQKGKETNPADIIPFDDNDFKEF